MGSAITKAGSTKKAPEDLFEGTMLGETFTYVTRYSYRYRYMVYRKVRFKQTIRIVNGGSIDKDIVYPYLARDLRRDGYLFLDEKVRPLIHIYKKEGTHHISWSEDEALKTFADYFSKKVHSKLIPITEPSLKDEIEAQSKPTKIEELKPDEVLEAKGNDEPKKIEELKPDEAIKTKASKTKRRSKSQEAMASSTKEPPPPYSPPRILV